MAEREKTPEEKRAISKVLRIVRGSMVFGPDQKPVTCPRCFNRIGILNNVGIPEGTSLGPMGCVGVEDEECKLREMLFELYRNKP
ncbi:hypothetical protein A3A76_01455 [Candidatus Woesebacteria bacterium RIFCSPLOWO2_01_FULL_39_23]|uniref:Uncharacterized protein n=1 Tax=Candidatus Woesebacteria bacterium RIFCSPHIGHO2_01_FULL_40_22 TaxID=1802499 RepID=A0A1F7YGL7_9BACT|nr:MAG: hypothetical protein A2141_04915 [Candidatus Woesebacteria bacterium RBG_16_40_11]OGM26491.1 MAG: hypothetical protein A2628_03050 [Candidatus Woesebacteria bacterium RIFCSPHIGHO2_01_FULL_40_22]OGM37660.1 MAG: hypothetical protein A3E41_05570 [Candidatus Woesebacteria bacterium RIFCSPHIGHO2_12_FULL_38_9]OGM62944.1 MAG: hypothetical protein A3A76_01455 [Candidatus Woesebacteria bacterium RIFCSPLOWO2_01_FULL_39_23]